MEFFYGGLSPVEIFFQKGFVGFGYLFDQKVMVLESPDAPDVPAASALDPPDPAHAVSAAPAAIAPPRLKNPRLFMFAITAPRERNVTGKLSALDRTGGEALDHVSLQQKENHQEHHDPLGPVESEAKQMELALELGADDVVTNDDGSIDVITTPEDSVAFQRLLGHEH